MKTNFIYSALVIHKHMFLFGSRWAIQIPHHHCSICGSSGQNVIYKKKKMQWVYDNEQKTFQFVFTFYKIPGYIVARKIQIQVLSHPQIAKFFELVLQQRENFED